jgi:WD40 repeat protein/beta-lactamase regulating signal transducer with metallopeptidase domain
MGLANALLAGLLAVLALVVGRCSRRPALVHCLWLLVLLKLVTPPVIPFPVPGLAPAVVAEPEAPTPLASEAVAGPLVSADVLPVESAPSPVLMQQRTMTIGELALQREGKILPQPPPPVATVEPVPALSEQPPIVVPMGPLPLEAPILSVPSAPPPVKTVVSLPELLAFAGWVWVGGAVIVFLSALWRMVRFQRLLRYARPAPEYLVSEARFLAERLDLGRCPEVWLIPGPVPPLLWAVGGRARLFFPLSLLPRLDEKGRTALLVHELAHLARRDHWVRWLELIVGCLYWWYPLVWLARLQLHAAEEECCDAWVTSELPEHRPAYAGALLETVDFLSRVPRPLPPTASGFGRVYQLKRRLTMIVRGSTPRGMSWLGKFVVLGLALALPLVPTRARPAPPARAAKADKADQAKAVDAPPPAASERETTSKASQNAQPELANEPTTYQPASRILQGGGGAVWATTVSPDGKTLAVVAGGVGDNEGALTLYDLPSGKERVTLTEPKPIRCVAFSRDGKHLATGDFNKLVQLRDPMTGAVRKVLSGHTASVNSLSFTPDSKTLVTGGLDNTIRVWDVSEGKETHLLKDHTNWVLCVRVARDGKTMISAGRDNNARIWDLPTFKTRFVLKSDQFVEGCDLSPDGKIAVTTQTNGMVKLWDATTGQHLRDLTGHNNAVNVPVFLDDGKKLATCSHDRTIRFWDVATGALEATIETTHQQIIYGLAVSPDGKTLFSGGWDQFVKVYDLPKREEKQSLRPRRYQPESNFPLMAIACSPNGKLLAVCGEERVVKIIETSSGQTVRLLEGHEDVVGRVAFSTDGRTLASAGFDGDIILWDIARGTRKQVLKGHANWVFGVVFSPDGKMLASCGYDKTVRLWDAKTGKPIAVLNKHRGGVRSIAFSPDSKQIASAGTDLAIRVWDIEKKESIQTIKGHEDAIRSVAFSVDGKRLLSAAEDSTVRLWNVADGKQVGLYRTNGIVREAIFSPRGRSLAVVSEDRSLRILDPDNLTQRMVQSPHGDAATCVAYSPDARTLFSGSADRMIRRWEAAVEARSPVVTLRTGAKQMWVASYSPDGKWLATAGSDKLLRVRPAQQGTVPWGLEGLDSGVLGIALSPDGKLLATAHMDQTIKLWDRETGKRKATLEGHKFRVWAVAFSPDGKKLVSAAGSWQQAGEPGEAKVWDLTTNKEEGNLDGHTAPVMGLAWSKDGKTIATGTRDGIVRLFDPTSRKELHVLRGHKDGARSAVFSPDSKYLCTGSSDGFVKIWSVADGKEITSLKGPEKGINCVDWSSDGKYLAATSKPADRQEPGEVRLWTITTPEGGTPAFNQKAVLKGHTAHLLSCVFSPDGKTLATSGGVYSNFGEVIVWDVETGKERMMLHGHRQWVEALVFSKDGRVLYSAGGTRESRGEVRAWVVEEGGWWVNGAHKGEICCAAWSKDGKLLATGCTNAFIKIWDPVTGKLQATLNGHKSMVRCLAFSPDGQTLASASSDKTVKLWDLTTYQEQAELTRHRIMVNGLAFSNDGTLLATSSADPSYKDRRGEIKVFDVRTGKERTGAQWANQPALSVVFSPDGKYLATGTSGANMLKVYDVKSGKLVRTVTGANSIRMIAFTPDGKWLASTHGPGSARGNGSIQIWDTTTWQEVMALTGHPTMCLGISFSHDGQRLASASNDGTVKLWDLTTPRSAASRMASRTKN